MNTHSILPPSSAARRVACPGSRALEAQYPQEDSVASREGAAAHWLAEWSIQAESNSSKWKLDGLCPESLGCPSSAPNGELITQEMIEGAVVYQKSVLDVCKMNIRDLHVEKRVSISAIHADCWGTPDCWYYTGETLHIWDYKFGHKFVEVFENWQLIEYAAGILSEIGNPIANVVFYIVQPRTYDSAGMVRTWRILSSDLQPYFNVLRETEKKAMSPNAACRPSPECTYCKGRHACQTLQRSALSAIDISLSNDMHDLKPDEIGKELRFLQRAAMLLDARRTGLEQQALILIKSGKRIPYFHVEETKGRLQWRASREELNVLRLLLDVVLFKDPEPVTPSQAIKAGMPEELVNHYSERKFGPLKLVADDLNKIRKIFGGKK